MTEPSSRVRPELADLDSRLQVPAQRACDQQPGSPSHLGSERRGPRAGQPTALPLVRGFLGGLRLGMRTRLSGSKDTPAHVYGGAVPMISLEKARAHLEHLGLVQSAAVLDSRLQDAAQRQLSYAGFLDECSMWR